MSKLLSHSRRRAFKASVPVGRPWAIISVVACGAVVVGIARAAEPSSGLLQEVVVTAEKREATVQATPISITALSGDSLANLGVVDVQDLSRTAPGLSFRTAGPGQNEYEMRGLASSGGSTATVGFYLDETPLSANAVALNGRTVIDADLFDLNHVEVLRGPQGTLYGAGSMGGTVKLVTNQPKLGAFEGAASVEASKTSAGGDLNGGGSIMLNFPIGDTAALRIVTTDKYVSGWIPRYVIQQGAFPYPTNFGGCGPFYYCTRGDVLAAPVDHVIQHSNNEKYVSTRATLLVKPSDALTVTSTLMYQRIDASGYNNYQQPPGPGTIGLWQPYDIAEPYYDSFKLANLTVNYKFTSMEITSATAYWKRFVLQSTDSTEALQNIFNTTTFVPNLYQERDPTTQFSEELRFSSIGEGRLQWVAGLYFQDLHSGYITYNQNALFDTVQSCPVGGPLGGHCAPGTTYNPNFPYDGNPANNPDGVVFNDDNPNVLKQKAVFGEVSYKLAPDLKLTVGARVFNFEIGNHSHQCGLGTASGNGGCTDASASGKNTTVLPKVNLSYEATPDLTVYSTVSKGARPGGVNLPIPLNQGAAYYCGPGSGPSYLVNQPFYYGPDSIWSGEIGEKARFSDRRISFNADVYYVKWIDMQNLIVLSCGYPYNRNIGEARAYGPEVEFSARMTDEFTFFASGAYTKAEINKPENDPTFSAFYPPGTRIINVPKYTYTVALEYETAFRNGMHGHVRLSDAYTGEIEDTAYYRQTLPAYSLVDLRAGITQATWSAQLFARNLTNKQAAQTIDNTVFAWQQPTITRVSTNQPRTVGIELGYKF